MDFDLKMDPIEFETTYPFTLTITEKVLELFGTVEEKILLVGIIGNRGKQNVLEDFYNENIIQHEHLQLAYMVLYERLN